MTKKTPAKNCEICKDYPKEYWCGEEMNNKTPAEISIKEFENSDKPMSFCLSYDPIKGKVLFSYFEGNSEDMLKKFKKDFPNMFHFHRENIASRRKWVKEKFNYDI